MENFTISSCLTTKEYMKVMIIGLYKKPIFILGGIIGIYYIITLILDALEVINLYDQAPYLEIFLGAFLLFSPFFITLIAVNQFLSNPNFKSKINYTFGENGLKVEGATFKGEFSWSHIIKQKEISKFLVLYHTKKAGNFIDKSKLTEEQLVYIKSKIENK